MSTPAAPKGALPYLPFPPPPPPPTAGPSSTSPVPQAQSTAPTARAKDYQPVKVSEGSAAKRSAKACQYCRKGKARCNGLEEYPCRRCRESGVECVFEGMAVEELKKRAEKLQEEKRKTSSSEPPAEALSQLETRLKNMEAELERLRGRADRHESRLDRLDGEVETGAGDSRSVSEAATEEYPKQRPRTASGRFEDLEREAFELFWEMYAPLAPYIDPVHDTLDNLRRRSPLLLHCIVAVASRFHENRDFVDLHRSRALKLMRETLYPEKPLNLDDLKGALVYNAWMGKGAPPGHTVALALQLDLPRSLERLLGSISGPPADAVKAFDEHMPAVRSYLILYAQDLWLSLAMNRRSLVTIDLSITSARLLLNFAGLRPVDGRVVAQSELVTILGVVVESFLKKEGGPAQTVHLVQQANTHMDAWVQTWKAWADSQDPTTGRYILASLTVMLQSGRFFLNTLGLRDITRADELQPQHLGCLRNALDAAVRIQGIHPAQKIAHSAEMTLISLSSAALFLLKMIKLCPHAFSPVHCPSYPSFAALASTPSHLAYEAAASSPDTSASPLSFSTPSINQALDAARHCAKLLSNTPVQMRSYRQAVEAALVKLEGELAGTPSVGLGAGGSSSGNGTLGKRSREGDEAEGGRPSPSQPAAYSATSTSAGNAPTAAALAAAPHPAVGPDPAFYLPQTPQFDLPPAQGLNFWTASGATGGVGETGADGLDGEGELTELTIESLVGADSFWSWASTLPGETIAPFIA
ncbi:hypothetical protein JCM10213_007697 [Rhodosporidiobolus nylandii]